MRQPLKEAFKEAMEEAEQERSAGARGRRLARTLLLVGAGVAIGYRLRSDEVETERARERIEESTRSGRSRGGVLRNLVPAVGAVGAAYALKSRMGSVDEVVDQAAEQVQTVAEQTTDRTDEAAGRISTVTGEAAEQIEEGGEEVAQQVEQGGEQAAEQVDEAAETSEESVPSDEDEK
ncbi:hypothetical protein [Natronoarchaeum mannanilyticum]|uniref:hypothetical protein n=1 Tax=Natronoarchaeum mannanilyticum TaxID=926360 RepID=UPI003670CA9F